MKCFTNTELDRYVELRIQVKEHLERERISLQPWYISHAETITQNVVGQILAFFILWAWGIETSTAWGLQLTFFAVAYGRGYGIRRFYELVGNKFLQRFVRRK